MAGHDHEAGSDLDLAALLWGDLAPASPPAGADSAAALAALPPPDPPSPTPPEARRESRSAERPPETRAGQDVPGAPFLPALADGDDEPPDLDADELLIELPDLDTLLAFDDDETGEPDELPDDAAPAGLTEQGEPPLGVGALTERLQREVFPRLQNYIASRGYLTLGHLGYAVAALQGSPVHLDQVRAFVERSGVPLFPSRAHHGARGIPLAVYDETRRRFGDLVHGEPDEALVVARLGYAGLQLDEGTRRFLVRAWLGHCLSRAEERAHAETIAAEIARVGSDHNAWSAAALAAREALILDNLWLVARVARKYIGQGLEVDDLLQIGVLGLCRAVAKLDITRENRFVTYASAWVRQSITRHIGDQARLIRMPIHALQHETRVREVAAQILQRTGRPASPEAVAAECGDIPLAVVRGLLVLSRPLSLDDPRNRAMIERRAQQVEDDLDDRVARDDLRRILIELLRSLKERERLVIEQRFGLNGEEPHTLEEIGQGFGVTRERIRQLEEKGLRKLQQPSRARRLREYGMDRALAPAPRKRKSERRPPTITPGQTDTDDAAPSDHAAVPSLPGPDSSKGTTAERFGAPSVAPEPNPLSELSAAALGRLSEVVPRLDSLQRGVVEARLGIGGRVRLASSDAARTFGVLPSFVAHVERLLLEQLWDSAVEEEVAQCLTSSREGAQPDTQADDDEHDDGDTSVSLDNWNEQAILGEWPDADHPLGQGTETPDAIETSMSEPGCADRATRMKIPSDESAATGGHPSAPATQLTLTADDLFPDFSLGPAATRHR